MSYLLRKLTDEEAEIFRHLIAPIHPVGEINAYIERVANFLPQRAKNFLYICGASNPFEPFRTETDQIRYNDYYLLLFCKMVEEFDGRGICGYERFQKIKEVYFQYKNYENTRPASERTPEGHG